MTETITGQIGDCLVTACNLTILELDIPSIWISELDSKEANVYHMELGK